MAYQQGTWIASRLQMPADPVFSRIRPAGATPAGDPGRDRPRQGSTARIFQRHTAT